MSFLSPIFLLGLPLVAIPIGIHLLNRRQQKVLNWGAMQFLAPASTRRRRLWKMSDLLLLLLRILAILFIVGALSRPLLPVTWLGHSGPRSVVLVIDPSLSMGANEEGEILFDRMLDKMDGLLEELSPSDTLQVIIAGDNPVWMQELPVEANPSEIRRIRSQIRQLEPTLGGANLTAAIHRVLDTPEDKEKMIRIINVLSDGQSVGWAMNDATPWAEINRLVEAQERPTLINLDFVDQAVSEQANLSVDELRTVRTVTAINQPVTVEALVHNRGTKATAASVLHWYSEDESLGISSIPPLAPGSLMTVSVTHTFDATGHFDLWCEIDIRDVLDEDNEAHLIFTITDSLPVLIVDGSSQADPLNTDVGYLLASLGFQEEGSGASPMWQSGFLPKLVSTSELAQETLESYRCIILANPHRLSRSVSDKLQSYVQNGGGLWVSLGDAITPSEFNETWYRDGVGLSPLPLITTIGDPDNREAFKHLQPPNESHPATQLLADLQRLDIDRVQVFRRHQFDELQALETSVLLRIDHGDALAVEQGIGRGRAIFLATPLGLTWSNFPVCQSYVAMVHEWIWYLAAPSFPRHNLALGEAILLDASMTAAQGELSIQLPNDTTLDINRQENSPKQVFRFTKTQEPGTYTVTSAANGQTSPFVVIRDPDESTLAKLDAAALSKISQMPGFQIGGRNLSVPSDLELEIPTTPIANSLLVTLLALVVGELVLAAWCTYQRNPKIAAVTMEG